MIATHHTGLEGLRFNRWTFVRFSGRDQHSRAQWECRCDCGSIKVVDVDNVRSGKSRSCGCLNSELLVTRSVTHGMSGSREYSTWCAMWKRCTKANDISYPNYGGRGITICERWSDFALFFADMGAIPSPEHSIERNDVNGNYEPSNCRWATQIEQARNRRSSVKLTFEGRMKTMAEWAEETGLSIGTIWSRISSGWTAERALTVDTCTKRFLEHNGKRLSLGEWSALTGLSRSRIVKRLALGWSVADALMRPVRDASPSGPLFDCPNRDPHSARTCKSCHAAYERNRLAKKRAA